MATAPKKTDAPAEKTVGDKVVDILHSVFGSKSGDGGKEKEDPIAGEIKKARAQSVIGGDRRKAMMDQKIRESEGM